MPFRVHSKTIFLTYSRCDATKEDIHAFLKQLIGRRFELLVTAHELHEDGGNHIHAFFTLLSRWDIRNERHFDYTATDGTVYHPKIESPKNQVGALIYTKQDGDYLEEGLAPPRVLPYAEGGSGEIVLGKRDAKFAELDECTDTVEDFMQELRAKHPYEFFTRGNQVGGVVE